MPYRSAYILFETTVFKMLNPSSRQGAASNVTTAGVRSSDSDAAYALKMNAAIIKINTATIEIIPNKSKLL